MQLKLDELIRSIEGAHNALVNLEDLSVDEISYVHQHYKHIARRARLDLKQGITDTGTPAANIEKIVRPHVQHVDVHIDRLVADYVEVPVPPTDQG